MIWYRASEAPGDTHHGTVNGGRLTTVCGAVHQVSATVRLEVAPGDPEQMCSWCQHSLRAAVPLADPDDPGFGDRGRVAVAVLIGVAALAIALIVALGVRP